MLQACYQEYIYIILELLNILSNCIIQTLIYSKQDSHEISYKEGDNLFSTVNLNLFDLENLKIIEGT